MLNSKDGKKIWDADKCKWIIIKSTKTKNKNGNKARQRPNKGNKRKGK